MLYGMGYSFGQLRSAVLAVSHPSVLYPAQSICWEGQSEKQRKPWWHRKRGQQQLKHLCIIHTVFILNPKQHHTGCQEEI